MTAQLNLKHTACSIGLSWPPYLLDSDLHISFFPHLTKSHVHYTIILDGWQRTCWIHHCPPRLYNLQGMTEKIIFISIFISHNNSLHYVWLVWSVIRQWLGMHSKVKLIISWTFIYLRSSACSSGIWSLSFALPGLKILFSFSCKQCLSVVQGTSTKIYKRTQYHHTTVHTHNTLSWQLSCL